MTTCVHVCEGVNTFYSRNDTAVCECAYTITCIVRLESVSNQVAVVPLLQLHYTILTSHLNWTTINKSISQPYERQTKYISKREKINMLSLQFNVTSSTLAGRVLLEDTITAHDHNGVMVQCTTLTFLVMIISCHMK